MTTRANPQSRDADPPSFTPGRGLLLQRKCVCGSPSSSLSGECAECKSKKFLKTKFAIGASNDPLEQEADRVADQVLAAPANPAVSGTPPRIQRFTGQSAGQTDAVPASVEDALAGPGSPLEPALERDMGQRFGYDFSRVRVHSGGAAEQSAREISANAYTVGHDMVFGAGRYAPHTQDGRRLLAHELTHVVQQPRDSSFVQRDLEDWQRVQDDLENIRQSAEARYQLRQPRRLNSIEEAAAKSVFGSALDTSEVIISEGGPMTIGGYARTLPDRIHFPEGSFARSDFLAYLIHELTHVWQYQRGANIPGMVWEAAVGIYKYEGEVGLRQAWADGQAFDEFTTEQQGDILSDYYQRLVDGADVSAYQPFIDDVRSGNETKHRFHSVEPLPAATLDVAKLNAEYRARTEAEIIRQLKMPMAPNDERAAARAHSIAQLFGRLTYWSTDYRERFAARRSDDVLVNLLFSRLSDVTRQRIFKTLGIKPAERAKP